MKVDSQKKEAEIHETFKHLRNPLYGSTELFRLDDSILDFVKQNCEIKDLDSITGKHDKLLNLHKQMYAANVGIVMTLDEELQIFKLYKEGKSNDEIQKLTKRSDGELWSESKIIKLRTKFNKGYVPDAFFPESKPKIGKIPTEDLIKELIKRGLSPKF